MVEVWGETKTGETAHRIRLQNGDLSAQVITYGASLQDLRLDGHTKPLVLGFESLNGYEDHGLYFGAIVGRYANRIAEGQFSLAGQDYQLSIAEDDMHHLHGGPQGFFNRIWNIESHDESQVVLTLNSADGDAGYPGNVEVGCVYSLTADNGLEIILTAQTDAPTICNLVNHAYFNLDDGGASDINQHCLEIYASSYLAADETNAPTGERVDVSGSEMDFRRSRPVRDFLAYDHNFCLADQRRPLTSVAKLVGGNSGIEMEVLTTEPGLQLYGGGYIRSMTGLDGIEYGDGAGICLEAQIWPDAPNHDGFPTAVLMPSETLRQKTVYRFRKDG